MLTHCWRNGAGLHHPGRAHCFSRCVGCIAASPPVLSREVTAQCGNFVCCAEINEKWLAINDFPSTKPAWVFDGSPGFTFPSQANDYIEKII